MESLGTLTALSDTVDHALLVPDKFRCSLDVNTCSLQQSLSSWFHVSSDVCVFCRCHYQFWSVLDPRLLQRYTLTAHATPLPDEMLQCYEIPRQSSATATPSDPSDPAWPCVSAVFNSAVPGVWDSLAPTHTIVVTPGLLQAAYALLNMKVGKILCESTLNPSYCCGLDSA